MWSHCQPSCQEELGHRHSLNKAETNASSVNSSLSIYLGFTVFWTPPALPSAAHTSCLPGSDCLRSSTAVLVSSHGTSISTVLRLLTAIPLSPVASPGLLPGAKPQLPCIILINPEPSAATKTASSPMASH